MRSRFVCSLVVATTLLSAGSGLAQTTSKWSYGFVDGGNIVAFAEESSSGTTVYAASNGGIFKTTSSGDNWSFLANSPAQMTRLAWDASASILYAANSVTAWKSTDHGVTWSQIYHSGMTPATYPGGSEVTLTLTGLVAGGGTVYLSYTETIGATGPLLLSSDAGKTWRSILPFVVPPGSGPTSGPSFHVNSIYDMKIDPYQSYILYIISCNFPIKWNGTNITSETCIHPISDQQVYASYQQVANAWNILGTQPLTNFAMVYPQRDAQGLLYAASDTINQYLCSGGNCDWSSDTNPPGSFSNFLVDGCLNNLLLVATNSGVGVNAYDSSQNWSYYGLKQGLGNNFTLLSVGPMALHCGGGAFAGLPGGVWLTEDIGSSWTAKNTGLTAANATTLTVGPDGNHTVWAGTVAEGLWKSADGGATWTPAVNGLKAQDPSGDVLPLSVNSIAIEPQNPQIMLAGATEGLFRSTDAGNTWSALAAFAPTNSYTSTSVIAVAADPLTAGRMYALTGNSVAPMLISTDSGKTFTKASSQGALSYATALALSPAVYPLYAATANGVLKLATIASSDQWKVVLSGNAQAVAVDPQAAQTIYAAIKSSGVVKLSKSTNGGVSWSPLTTPAGAIDGLFVDSSSTLYIAAAAPGTLTSADGGKTYDPVPGGLWSSADGGKTFNSLGVLAGRDVLSVTRDAATGNVYAGLAGLGVAVFSKAASAPILSVTPSSLSFTVKAGAASPAAQTVTIKNTGTASMSWTAAKTQSWLTLSLKSGALAPGASATVSAQPSTTALAAGQFSDTITVTASGAKNAPSSVAVALAVQLAATTTGLSTSASSVAVTKPVTFTATVSTNGPKALTGSVTFADGAKSLGVVALKSGAASLTISTLAAGVHSITASYPGDSYNASSKSSVLTQTITAAPTVSTTAATSVSTPRATLNGTVAANNATTQYWFAYGTSGTALTTTTAKTGALTGATATAVSATLTNLKSKTKYYFQAVASNAVGTTPGAILSFTTN